MFLALLAALATLQSGSAKKKLHLGHFSSKPPVSCSFFTKIRKYSLKNVPYGKYKMVVSILSFDTLVVYIDLKEPSLNQNLILGGSVELEEVKIIGNVVRGNNVPIAVTTISTKTFFTTKQVS